EQYRRRGHRPYVIKGSPTPPGPVGYVNAAIEVTAQVERVDWLFMPSTGGTQGGLMLGAEQLGLDWKVVGISPSATTAEAAREQGARPGLILKGALVAGRAQGARLGKGAPVIGGAPVTFLPSLMRWAGCAAGARGLRPPASPAAGRPGDGAR